MELLLKTGSLALLMFLLCPLLAHAQPGRSPSISERILVIHQVSDKKDVVESRSVSGVYDGIVEGLTDKGYRVVDKQTAEAGSMQLAITHEIDPALNSAAAYGLKFLAEYTIFFKTSTILKARDDSSGALVKSSASVVNNTTAQILTAKTAESSSAGHSPDNAVDKASRAAGKKLASALVSTFEKQAADGAFTDRTYVLVLETGPDNKPLQILSKLEGNPSVIFARETESGGGKSTMEVGYRGKRDQLDRDLLKAAGELGWKLSKIRSEGNRSSWKIK